MTRVLALDAMGVIYKNADDVAELLVPFVLQQGGKAGEVEKHYQSASLGKIEADMFWRNVGVDPCLEDR